MSLLDLKSDLSKYRSEPSREEKNEPQNSVAKNSKSFATVQPISDSLLDRIPQIKKPTAIDIATKLNTTKLDDIKKPKKPELIENKLGKTKLDDIIRKDFDDMLLNSVSEYSPSEIDINSYNLGRQPIEKIVSKFDDIKRSVFVSSLDKSDTLVLKSESGTNNNKSDTEITSKPFQFDRTASSPDILVNPIDSSDNIVIPKIKINGIPLSIDRQKQSVIIDKDLLSPINNILSPDIALQRTALSFNRAVESPNIIKDTIKEGLVVDPNINVFRLEQGTNHFQDNSNLNLDKPQIYFIQSSLLAGRKPALQPDTVRYNPFENKITDNSNLNIDTIIKTNPSGRNDDPSKSIFYNDGSRAVDYFGNSYFRGFSIRQSATEYTNLPSAYGWKGGRGDAPTVNFVTDVNARGFEKFARIRETSYKTNSSKLGFVTIQRVNFFDIKKEYATEGFTPFPTPLETFYIKDSSRFTWVGPKDRSPAVNYFDIEFQKTTAGFHGFAQLYDSKFIAESSIYDWDGKRENAPTVNYFDINSSNTNAGFHSFAQLYDTKYIPETSRFDWDGTREDAPAVNYFDLNVQHTNAGFHNFAQLYDTKYIPEASIYDWDGARLDAPTVNYFDLNVQHTTVGFHSFAQKYDTKYIPEASEFDWDGTRDKAPAVDYFDFSKRNTTQGFHTFAQKLITKYVPESSDYDWDGVRLDAPSVDYFDISKSNTTVGFHTFAPHYETKYVPESSRFDWDGSRQNAPSVNYFDTFETNRTELFRGRFTSKTSAGFHTFAQRYDTKYIPESSEFDWNGSRLQAPAVNYFDTAKTNRTESEFPDGFSAKTTAGFHTFARMLDTKYIKDSSRYDWNGKADRRNFRNPIPVDFFDNTAAVNKYGNKFFINTPVDYRGGVTIGTKDKYVQKTFGGFHIFAQLYDSKYVPESSRFDWDGKKGDAPAVNYFDTAQSNRTTSEENSLLADFNKPRQFVARTTAGFHVFAQKYDSKYINYASIYDWDGVADRTGFTNPIPVDFFDTGNTNRTESEFPNGFVPHTKAGFHIFAQRYDSKFIDYSSIYDWDGIADRLQFKNPIPVDFFDNNVVYSAYQDRFGIKIATKDAYVQKTTAGFHTFAQTYDSKYIPEASRFDWDGKKLNAPSVNYFDNPLFSRQTNVVNASVKLAATDSYVQKTFGGFDTFIDKFDSRYIPGASIYDWDGKKNEAPAVDFFDTTQTNRTIFPGGFKARTKAGFHTFAGLLDSKYIEESSGFDWDGKKINAPAVNFFIDKFGRGFTKFATPLLSEYVRGISRFDWDGDRKNAPAINYFPKLKPKTDFAIRLIANSIAPQGSNLVKPQDPQYPNFFTISGLDFGFKPFATNKTFTIYSPFLSELSVAARQDRYTNFFSAPNNFRDLESGTLEGDGLLALGDTPGLVRGVKGFIPFLGSKNKPTYDPSIAVLGGLIKTKTLGSNLSLVDAKSKYTRFFAWGNYPDFKHGFLPNMTLLDGTMYPIILPPLYSYDTGDSRVDFFKNREYIRNARLNPYYPPPPERPKQYVYDYNQYENGNPGKTSGGGSLGVGGTRRRLLTDEQGRGEERQTIDAFRASLGNWRVIHGYDIDPWVPDQQKFLDTYLPDSLGKRPWSSKFSNNVFATMFNQYPIYQHDPTYRFYGYRRPTNDFNNLVVESKAYNGYIRDGVGIPGYRGPDLRFAGGHYEQQLRNGWWAQPVTDEEAKVKKIKRTHVGSTLGTSGMLNEPDGRTIWERDIGYWARNEEGENLVRKYGFIGRWAIMSGELGKQYNKYDLREDSYNPDLFWKHPYYVSDIGASWGWGALACGRMSPTTLLDRRLADAQRMSKFLTSGKGLLWTLKQFGLQFMNPFVDTWNEPFDLFEERRVGNENIIDSYGNQRLVQRDVSVRNQALLPNFFGNNDGSGGLKSLIGNVRIFMPPPTMVFNPLSTFMSAVYGGRDQRHIKSSAFGFQGPQQWNPQYAEQIGQELIQRTVDPSGNTVSEKLLSQVTRPASGTGPQNLGFQTIRKFPDDLNQHYEAQTTYRNKTGFMAQSIGGVDYKEKTFHEKQNGDFIVPTNEVVDWYTLSRYGAGQDQATNYFETPQKADPITRQRRYNRLIGLMKEMLPQSFSPMVAPVRDLNSSGGPQFFIDEKTALRVRASTALLNIHQNRLSDGEIIRISSNFGGPGSFLGLGGTTINKSKHKLLGTYTTIPTIDNQKIIDGTQRETFFAKDFYASYSDRLRGINALELSTAGGEKGEVGGDLKALAIALNPWTISARDYVKDGGFKDPYGTNAVLLGEQVTIQPITQMRLNQIKPFEFLYPNNLTRLSRPTVTEEFRNSADAMDAGPNPTLTIISDEQRYKTSPYKHLGKVLNTGASFAWNANYRSGVTTTAGSLKFNDFRWDIEQLNASTSGPIPRGVSPESFPIYATLQSMKFSTHPGISDYANRNLENQYGLYENVGDAGSNRGNPRKTNIIYQKITTIAPAIPGAAFLSASSAAGAQAFATYPVPVLKTGTVPYEFRGDRINIIDYKRANFPITRDLVYETGQYNNPNLPGRNDLIEFYFSSIVLRGHNYCPAEVIVFRATFDSITDNHKPSWSPVKYMGRGDPLYTYDGYERDVSFNFTVHIGSRDEMKATWRKLNYLASWTMPEYTGAGYIRAPLIRLNIGNLFRKMPGYISNLSYTFDNVNHNWETANLYGDRYYDGIDQNVADESKPGVLQLPKTIQVSVGYVPVGVYRPERYGVVYPLYDDRSNSNAYPENGLIPQRTDVVNWFETFDTPGANIQNDTDSQEYLAVPPVNFNPGTFGGAVATTLSTTNPTTNIPLTGPVLIEDAILEPGVPPPTP